MEVVIPVPATMDFDFNSARSSPYLTAPSTPKRFGEYYFSAPTSPARLSEFYRRVEYGDDFAFDVSEGLKKTASLSVSADELFDGGKIRPLLPGAGNRKSPVRSHSKRTEQERGRERVSVSSWSSSGRRATRSLSPFRWEQEEEEVVVEQPPKQSSIIPKPSTLSSSSSSKGCRMWRLKDFFLFRSASEGRAADKDPLKKYTALFIKKHQEAGSINSGHGSKRRGAASAHELHYTVNRAVSEDLKKKTFLPYKQGILGRLAFNPAVHALANGFGFSRR